MADSNIVGNSKRQHINETSIEYRMFIINTSNIYIIPQKRDVTTAGWTATVDAVDYPAQIGTSTNGDIFLKRNTPLANSWYRYEEIWKKYGDWENVDAVTT